MWTYDNPMTVYQKILSDYAEDDTELNGDFFDCNVKDMKKVDLIKVYSKLVTTINGDKLAALKNVKEEDGYLSGELMPFECLPELNGTYTGNYRDFLNAQFPSLFRLYDWKEKERKVTGKKLTLVA